MAVPGTAPEQPDLASVLEGPDKDDMDAQRAGEAALAEADAGSQPVLALPAPPDAGAACLSPAPPLAATWVAQQQRPHRIASLCHHCWRRRVA